MFVGKRSVGNILAEGKACAFSYLKLNNELECCDIMMFYCRCQTIL